MGPIAKYQVVKTLNTSEQAYLGGYTVAQGGELRHIRMTLYKHGAAAGSEQMRLALYSRSDLNGLLAQSDWLDVADFATSTYWFGYVRFDFDRYFLHADQNVHLTIETQNYTRDVHTFYLGVVSDWPTAGNDPQSDLAYFAAAASFFDFRTPG